MTKTQCNCLTSFWISFPEDNEFPFGIGITAFTLHDAYSILENKGINYLKEAKIIEIIENIKWDDIPNKEKVHPEMGPIVVRGIWYPYLNT